MDHPRLRRNVTSMFPEQISLEISSPTAMWVSWITGEAQVGTGVTPLDPTTVASEVWYGKESGKYSMKKTGASMVYSQLYPFEGLLNYTSGIIHHVRIDGLEPATRYLYRCGDSDLSAMSEEHVFETLPLPGPTKYPRRIALVGDLGLTNNSTTTVDHLMSNDPSMVLMATSAFERTLMSKWEESNGAKVSVFAYLGSSLCAFAFQVMCLLFMSCYCVMILLENGGLIIETHFVPDFIVTCLLFMSCY